MTRKICIATRKSPLALWQAEFVKEQLLKIDKQLQITLMEMTTQGDIKLEHSLSKFGGKGLFIKELEKAMLDGQADIAVHSMKDMTVNLPEELVIGACCERHDPRDAFVSNQYASLESLPERAVVGTSSLRRQSQLLAIRPDLQIKLLRGNVGTRLAKLDNHEYDAIILAAAGLKRLGLRQRITAYLPTALCLPAVGQGIIGIECRKDDEDLRQLLRQLNNTQTETCLAAERAMNQRLEGGCQVPIAGFATLNIDQSEISLEGRVASIDGVTILIAKKSAPIEQAELLGEAVANELLAQGAKAIIDSVYHG